MKYTIQNIKLFPKLCATPVLLSGLLIFGQNVWGQQKKQHSAPKPAASASKPNGHSSFALEVEGVVLDASTKKTISGSRVFYRDLASSITKEDGTFKIKLPNDKAILSVEAFGYDGLEIAVAGRKKIQIYLQQFDGNEGVYTLPTKQVSEYYHSDAATSLSLPDSWSSILESPDTYLQGKVAGLNVVRHSGTSNSGSFFNLRGINSIYATNKPLIVVDGVIYDSEVYGSSTINNFFDNPLSYIDPRDISNITVLKDASAAALYGTKGANGVILITTARAKELGTKIDFALYGGVNTAPTSLPVMNAANYRTYLNDLMTSQGLTNSQIQAADFMNDSPTSTNYYNTHNETDWQKKIYSVRPLTNVYFKISGGDNIAKYALSINYLGNNNSLEGSSLSKYSTRFNADLNLTKRLTATANLSFSYNSSDARDGGGALKINPVYLALVKAPFYTSLIRNSQGVFSPRLTDVDAFNIGNPIAATQNVIGQNRAYRFQGIIDFKYKLNQYFNLGSNVAITFDKITENHFTPDYGLLADTLMSVVALRQASSQAKKVFNLYNETYLSFEKLWNNRHDFSGRTGFRFMNSSIEQTALTSYNSAIDELSAVQSTTPLYNGIDGIKGTSNWLNSYLNLNYNYAGKYFLTFNAALDGSSRFGKQITANDAVMIGTTPFAFMPSLSTAWVLSSEKFMANSGVDLLKIRLSAGRVGNDDIGNYSNQKYYASQNFLGSLGLIVGGVANPNLKWETVTKVNAGLDFVGLKQRVSLSLDVFQNKTTDMLTWVNAPVASGVKTMLTNGGAMSTTGFEATVNLKLINKSQVKWDLGFNVAQTKSVVEQLPSDYASNISSYSGSNYVTAVGYAPNSFYGVVANGVYSTSEEALKDGYTTLQADGTYKAFKAGDVRFVDVNGDKIIDAKDYQVLGNPNPNFYGGVSNHLTYKNWTLDALVSFVSGNSVYNYTRRKLESGSAYENQSNAMLTRWKGQGQITDIPRATYGDPMQNNRFSSRWIEDGSYARLRTITLSYNFNIASEFLRYVTVYATANNLVTLTKYLGYDPEFSSTNSIIGQGVDNSLEPTQKSFHVGVKLGL